MYILALMDQKTIVRFLVFWLSGSIVILLAGLILGGGVVLGNNMIAPPMAAVTAGFVLTMVYWLVTPRLAKSGFWQSLFSGAGIKVSRENQDLALNFVINSLLIWVIKRFADVSGLGIANIFFVLLLSALVTAGWWSAPRIFASLLK